tara:strand:- start:2738 stop:2992 length:255 start_codon:yes stop_codon:yes gene_type:complete
MHLVVINSEHFMSLNKKSISNNLCPRAKDINQGDCVQLINDENMFQVIGVDNNHHKCWLREWPLHTNGSPVFEIAINQVVIPTQ